eukprot:INCI8260.2.p1 GENE.INCI8260.2~~INCI8260.2.p1  ORF type:complete len:607 (-),score=105.06 INCI8260.2:142-1962(-)
MLARLALGAAHRLKPTVARALCRQLKKRVPASCGRALGVTAAPARAVAATNRKAAPPSFYCRDYRQVSPLKVQLRHRQASSSVRTTAGVVTYRVALFGQDGEVQERVVNGAELKSKLSLLSTDIIGFESGIRRSPIILPREKCTIVMASHVKMIIGRDFALVFDYHRPVVRHFVQQLQYILHGLHTFTNMDKDASEKFSEGTPSGAPSETSAAGNAFVSGLDIGKLDSTPPAQKPVPGLEPGSPALTASTSVLNVLSSIDGSGAGTHSELLGLGDELVMVDQGLPYELRMLSAVLGCICAKYRQRLMFMTPVLQEALAQMHSIHPRPEDLSQLLPLRNSLSAFETSVNETLEAIKTVLNDDEDMVAMLLTRATRGQSADDHGLDVSVEVLLENHYREFMAIYREIFGLRKTIQATQELLTISLDNHRNRLIQLNVTLAMVSCGVAMSTTITSMFGMNLISGFEAHPSAFWAVVPLSVACGGAFFGGLFMKERGYMVSKQQDDMKAMQMLHLRIDDIQEIILQQLNQKRASGADGFSPSEFSAAIRSAVGQQLTADELSLLFRVYNKKGDGRLSTTDVLRFLCDHQGHHQKPGTLGDMAAQSPSQVS